MKIKVRQNVFILFLVCFSLVSLHNSHAQQNKIYELKDQKALKNPNNIGAEDHTIPHDFLFSLKPTIYLKNNAILNVTGLNKPVGLTSYDGSSLSILKTENPLFNSVKVLKIQLNEPSDLGKVLDFSSIREFSSLQYIYVMCYFKCTEHQIRAFIQNANPEIIVYFENVNPS
ncbi:hypothetical protein ACFFU9_02585 [Mariniflexile ostreae]|uniref:Leucine rich repeat (LRR) protein n=1 Tax=Mariniflexile ostreae TaxID=1520892 RepID=A0ABV5F843_9FLAO